MAQPAEKPQMLNSWKEIATFLGRGVRTVQRWERELELPVHRIGKGKRSPVFASVPELKFWVATSGTNHTTQHPPETRNLSLVPPLPKSETALEMSHRLMAESLKLVRTVAESSVRQQRQAEALRKQIMEIRSRMR